MGPFVSAVANWLTKKFTGAVLFPAPNNALSIRHNDTQYDVFLVGNASDAMTAAASIRTMHKYPLGVKRVGVIAATSAALASDPSVQSAVMSNYQGDAVYLGYLTFHEVKKWPPTAP